MKNEYSLRSGAFLAGVVALAAVRSLAGDGGEGPREFLTPEEEAEREGERRKEAPPALSVTPARLRAEVRPGETAILRLTVRNTGGRTLQWSVLSAPKWARIDRRKGSLGHRQEHSLVIVADPEGLPAGPARGNIVIVAPDAAGSPATIPAALQVRKARRVRPPPDTREPEPPAVEPLATAGTTMAVPGDLSGPGGLGMPAGPRKGRWGMSFGMLLPQTGDGQELVRGPIGVLFYRFGAKEPGKKGLDIGWGYSEVYSTFDFDDVGSRLLIGRARAIFPVGGGTFCFTAGGQVVSEHPGYEGIPEEDIDKGYMQGTADLGALLRLGKRFELGVTYSILIESQNVPAMLDVGIGLIF